MQRHRRGNSRSLTQHRAARHVARRRMGDAVAARGPSRDQQVRHAPGQHGCVGHLEVAPGRRQDQDPVAVDELGIDPDRSPRTDPGRGRRIRSGSRSRRSCGCRAHRRSCRSSAAERRRTPACTGGALRRRASPGAVLPSLPGSGHRGRCRPGRPSAPRSCRSARPCRASPPTIPSSVVRFGRDHAVAIGLLEGLSQERREHLVLLAGGLDVPLAVADQSR